MEKIIPIVTTTDSAYVLNCYISLFSIINVSDKRNIYHIYIMITDLAQEDIDLLESLSGQHVTVRCVDIFDIVKHAELQRTAHFPVQTYYRMFIPLAFPEYEKILYLDSDLCVLHDISELFDSDLEEYAVGVVRDVPCAYLDRHDRKIGNLDCTKTFNSGVMLLNTKVFEENYVREKCLDLLSEDYKRDKRKLIYADNDALNIVLYEQCKLLDDRWNFQWQYLWKMETMYEEYRKAYKNTAQEPYIIHFTGKIKPWTHPDFPMADTFWDLAEKAGIARRAAWKSIVDVRKEKEIYDSCTTFPFPYSSIVPRSKIAIYGAGQVGKAFYKQMQITNYAEVVIWADKNHGRFQYGKVIEPPCTLLEKSAEYQYAIIAIEDKQIAGHAWKDLIGLGIPEEKLVWSQYKIEKT